MEPLLAGNSLASYSTELLVALATAYYIDQPDEDDDDGFGSYGGLHDDGILEVAIAEVLAVAITRKRQYVSLARRRGFPNVH